MNKPRRFEIPPEEDPEPGLPTAITHGCDYMLVPRGDGRMALEFYYNFLDYTWNVGGSALSARHYLDEPGTISVMAAMASFDQPDYTAIQRYLQRRFTVIRTFEADGARAGTSETYVERWRHARMPDPD
jgi:hypothetical protein